MIKKYLNPDTGTREKLIKDFHKDCEAHFLMTGYYYSVDFLLDKNNGILYDGI